MFWLGFGIYTMFLVLIFAFFIIAKIHTYKFRHYSTNIEPVTKALAAILCVLALVGYYLLFSGDSVSTETHPVDEPGVTEIY